jgi:hypothetical protein
MKQHKAELDVDFIGGLGPLTKEDETAISAFIKARKIKEALKAARSSNAHKNSRKVVVEKRR